jgi:hypothetical protein
MNVGYESAVDVLRILFRATPGEAIDISPTAPPKRSM